MKTGLIGHGWIGKPLKKKIEANEINCLATSLSKPDIENNVFRYTVGKDLPRELKTCTTIIICTPPSFRRNDPNLVLKNYRLLLNQLPQSSRIIYTSSTSVYENQGTQDENSKSSGNIHLLEQMIQNRFNNYLILRLGGLAGPDRSIVNILSKKKILNNYNAPTNLLHLDDAVNAIFLGLQKETKGIYNVVAPEHPTKIKVYNTWSEKLGFPLLSEGTSIENAKTVTSHKWLRDTDFKFSYSSPEKFDF